MLNSVNLYKHLNSKTQKKKIKKSDIKIFGLVPYNWNTNNSQRNNHNMQCVEGTLGGTKLGTIGDSEFFVGRHIRGVIIMGALTFFASTILNIINAAFGCCYVTAFMQLFQCGYLFW